MNTDEIIITKEGDQISLHFKDDIILSSCNDELLSELLERKVDLISYSDEFK